MPGLETLIVIALADAGIGFGAAIFIGKLVVGIITSVVLNFVSRLLSPKPKTPNLSSFSSQASNRTLTIRQPITPWRFLYGEARIAGPMTFLEVTGDNRFLHMVVTLGAHPFDAVIGHQLDDEFIALDHMDGNGNVTAGRYAGKVRIQIDLGTTGSQPFPDLVSESTKWTSTHRQDGRAKAYIRFEFDRDKFPSGVPNYSAWCRGKKIFDPRTSTTAWTPNAALCLRDYMLLATKDGGLGAQAAEFDENDGNAAANICDEMVATVAVAHEIGGIETSRDAVGLQGTALKFQTGDRVQLTTTGTLPGGLAVATDYFVIVNRPHKSSQIQFAASYSAALAATAIDLTSVGSGTHTVTKNAEPRYTANGVIETDTKRSEIIEDLVISMGGRAVNSGGVWRLAAAAWVAPTLTFDESDARGPLRIDTKISRRDRFNAIKGIYVSPLNNGVPTDYPAVTNATYETEDKGERIFRDLDLPFTSRSSMAQRLAKIELERARQEITFTKPLSLAGMKLRAGITASITNARMGWAGKAFECTNWGLATRDNDGAPEFIVNPVFRETAAAVFDWNLGEETTVDPAPNTNLPDPFNVTAPAALVITEALFSTRDGSGVKSKAILTWDASGDSFVEFYQAEYKLASSSAWIVLPRTPATTIEIIDPAPGIYEFRVKAVNDFRVSSAYTPVKTKEILGLLVPPADITGLTISTIGGLAILRWDQHPDLDVREGGKITFRHAKALTGASWQTSTSIGDAVPGNDSVAVLPLKSGTYLAKAVDGSGVASVNAVSVSTKQATALAYTAVGTITEQPNFAGAHSSTVAVDSILQLDGLSPIDDWGPIDDIADWDTEGGIAAAGTYDFDSAFDFGSVVKRRLTAEMTVLVVNALDKIDDRTALIDDWEDFDGTGTGSGDVQIMVRETDDDPGGSPVWGPWQRLDSGEFEARAFEFQARLSSSDPAYNIQVSELTIQADQVT